AHEVVDLGLERLAVAVEPGVRGDVPAIHEDRARVPVVHLAGQEVPPLQQQDLLARAGQGMRQRPPAGPGPDDDHVIVLSHGCLPRHCHAEVRPSAAHHPQRGAWCRAGAYFRAGCGPAQISSSWRARRTASPRCAAASLWQMCLTWDLTVLAEMYSSL